MRKPLPFAIAIACALASIASIAYARADDEALRLTWTAPPGCPTGEDVRSATLRGTVSVPAATNGEILEVDAQVERARDGDKAWRVRLRTRRGSITGEREIEGTTCTGVADATAVLLALALVPPGTAPEPEPSSPASTEPPAEDAPTSKPDAPRRSDDGHRFAFGAGVAGDASSLPAFAVGGALTLAFTPDRLRLEVDARRWGSQSQSVTGSTAGARFSMTTVGGRACWAAIRSESFDAAPCVGGDVHFIDAPGYGADANYSATGTWGTVAGGLLGRVGLTSWLAARARVDAFVPLSRPTFVVENEGSVHRPPTLGLATSLGVEMLFL